jgi:peptidoglycan lytic transglycosylase
MIRHLNVASFGVVMIIALPTVVHAQSGLAAVYSYSHKMTASGERFSPHAMTAAHRTLPFGTRVRVTNRRNGRSIIVRVNDRGPYGRGRIVDLTPAGARALSFSGLAPVNLEVVQQVREVQKQPSIADTGGANSFQ